MQYWIDLFTFTTWQEFVKAGGTISGFREGRWKTVQKMKKGDLLLCYMTGLSRFFGILEVTDKPYMDDKPIWGEAVFPCRVPVSIVLSLQPEFAVPVVLLKDQLSYFQNAKTPHAWSGHFRGSPTQEHPSDAKVIIETLEDAYNHPISREFDLRKLERKVPLYETTAGTVTIPEDIETPENDYNEVSVSHEEIQWTLLQLGSKLGLDVWVARNDKSKSFKNNAFNRIPRLQTLLPTQFDEATNRTIELIDVLWLKGKAIVAAFEVEHTTSIYSGLLRMSDLVSMQPNIDIRLYIVAPDERRGKVFSEINRPTFTHLPKPLTEICQYISYSGLLETVQKLEAMSMFKHLKPEFLDEIAESFGEAE